MPKVKKGFVIRFYEIFPGVLTWGTLLGAPILSYYHPVWISIFIIAFDLYWFLKGGNVALHLLHSYATLRTHAKINWMEFCERVQNFPELKIHLATLVKTEKNRRLRNLYADQLAGLEKLDPNRNFDWKR